jgi:carbamate kinase
VEAVIDKDLAAAVLGRALDVDALCIATDVDAAVVGFGTPDARPVGRVDPAALRRLADEGHFATGSMGPKVEAALRFVERGGARAVITSLGRLADGVRGRHGTVVEKGD